MFSSPDPTLELPAILLVIFDLIVFMHLEKGRRNVNKFKLNFRLKQNNTLRKQSNSLFSV